jgi:hypothetical protein
VSVADFGVVPGVTDAGPGLRAAIAKLGKQAGSTLHFPPGRYRFAARDGNAMVFDDMDHLSLEGAGAELLFNGTAAPLLMRGCHSPRLKGLTFDWERPPFSQGEVTGVGSDHKTVTLRIDADFSVDGSEQIQQLGTYDRHTGAMTRGGIDDGGSVAGASLVGPQMLQLTLKRPVPFKVGDTVVARHGNGPHALQMVNCQNLSIADVTIYASPAMAIALGGCGGVSLQNVMVQPRPGSGRLLSTNADGLHCASCSGEISVTNCTFSGMGDDGINVTGLYLAVKADKDRRTLTLTGGRRSPAPNYAAPQSGDRLLLVSGRTLKPIAEVQAQAVNAQNNGGWVVQVSSGDAALNDEPMFAIDERSRTQLQVSHCRFPGNRGRGVLAHSDTVIEDCVFEHQSGSAVLLAPDMYWQEGPAVERTVVRRNQMKDGNLLGRAPSAVWIGAFVSPDGRQGIATPEIINRNIGVEHNVFIRPNGQAVAAVATRDLRIEQNQIEHSGPIAFSLENVRNVRLQGNRCAPPAAIRVGSSSHNEVALSGNVGLRITS